MAPEPTAAGASPQGRWASPTIRVRMLTGKAKGLTFDLPDLPAVLEHHGERLLCIMPGMQGECVRVPERPECN